MNSNIIFTKDEIITLSFGRTSNLVATSLFNSYVANSTLSKGESNPTDDRIMFRNTTTYAPRSLLIDMKGSFGGVTGSEQQKEAAAHWEGPSDTYVTESLEEDSILSKFDSRIGINQDRSIHELKEVKYIADTFDTYNMGQEYIHNRIEESEDIIDKIRYLIEECDSLQGFQVLVDANSAFPGIAHELITQVKDEFKSPRVLTFAISNPTIENNDNLKTYNLAMSLTQLSSISNVYIPLSYLSWKPTHFPLLHFDTRNEYQNVALLSSCIDACLLACRAKSDRYPLSNLCDLLSPVSKMNIGNILTSIPFPTLPQYQDFKSNCIMSMTQQFDLNAVPIAESITTRGIAKSLFKEKNLLKYLLDDRAISTTGFIDEQMYNVPVSFPKTVKNPESVVPVALYTNMQISRGMTKYLTNMTRLWNQLDKSLFPIDKEHANEISNELETISEQYQEA